MSETGLLRNLGFEEDPFEHHDADEEDRLPEYFVTPPYFEHTFGNPQSPKSYFVFAPRGGGKSAQRIMMEDRCGTENVLAISYDDFTEIVARHGTKVTLEDHIRQILARGYFGLLAYLRDQPDAVRDWSGEERRLLADEILRYVGNQSEPQIRKTVDSLRGFKGRTRKWLSGIGSRTKALSIDIGALTQELLRLKVDWTLFPKATSTEGYDARHELERFVSFSLRVGFSSVYVLVDKADETNSTQNNPRRTYLLLEPLITSLTILQTRGVAFKFFLWDAIEPLYRENSRPDRIGYELVKWEDTQLIRMLQSRLAAHSNQAIRKLDSISSRLGAWELDRLALAFAKGSPRDLVRLCKDIVAEQRKIDPSVRLISADAIGNGIMTFSTKRVRELYEANQIQRFRVIGSHAGHVDFTNRYLATDVFRRSQNAIRQRIKEWRDRGYIDDLGYIANDLNPSGRSVKLYGVQDIRLGRAMTVGLTTHEFLNSKVRQCEQCRSFLLRDWETRDSSNICHECGYDLVKKVANPNFVPPTENMLPPTEDKQLPLEALLQNTQEES